MKKQVLFFIESLQCGGAEKSLISLLPLLDYSKMDVDLLLLKRGGLSEQYVPREVRIIDFNQRVSPWLYRIYQLRFSLRLRWNRLVGKKEHGAETRWKMMQRAYTPLQKQYDVAIAYQQGFPTYYIIDKVDAGKKCTWINADITQVGYDARFNRSYYDKADVIVPVSDRLKDILVVSDYVPADKLFPVFDIVNPQLIRTMAKEPQGMMQNGGLKIVTVGRMVRLKGYDMAVEAARILRDRGLKFCWYFIGDGDDRTAVETLIDVYALQGYIKLLGEQANPYPYINACDIYVQTSRNEGFGLTIAEAKILRKPIVSTDFPVVHDQIIDGKNGLIAKMKPEDIANKIMQLINDSTLQEEIVRNLQREHNTTSEEECVKVNNIIVGLAQQYAK